MPIYPFFTFHFSATACMVRNRHDHTNYGAMEGYEYHSLRHRSLFLHFPRHGDVIVNEEQEFETGDQTESKT